MRNEIAVGKPTTLENWTDDSYLTSKVMANMLGNKDVNQYHVKVVTEGGVVYLMGLVTRKEGEAAAQAASTTSGVKRVVKVFEYTG